MADILDDGNCQTQPIRKLKSVLDVSEQEAMAWARWGASKWIRGQPRLICDNKCGAAAEPRNSWQTTPRKDFWGMARGALDLKATEADVLAVFKLAAILVNSNDWVYYKKAGPPSAAWTMPNRALRLCSGCWIAHSVCEHATCV